MSKIGCGIALVGLTLASAGSAAAEPISYRFSTTVTQAFGPIHDLFGRTFVRGDLLSGWVVIDTATLGSDVDPRDDHGQFAVGAGRVVFDVPSGFSMDASAIDRFDAIVQNGAPGAGQMLDYSRVDLYDQLSVDPWMFNALLVTWVDPAGLALSSTAWPTSVEGFRVTELRFNGFRGQTGSITLYGDSPAPIPEPATMSLCAAGLLATYVRARRRRSA